jgi:site-specific recombinase XerD
MEKTTKPLPSHLTDFLEWLEIEKGLSSKSQENYARFLKKFLDWLKINNLEDLKPHGLTSEHIRQYRLFLARQYLPKTKSSLKKSTQGYYLIALRSFLNYFADRDILSLPAEKIKLAKDKGEKEVRFLDIEQLEKLFSAPNTSTIQGLRDRAILETFFSTGMRIAELVALNREQIRIKPGQKDLELSIVGKGGRIRVVYFSERALTWLRKYLETRHDKDKSLFINYRSKKGATIRLTPRSIEKMIKKHAILAGLPLTTTPHVMRHSFATDLLAQGVDLRTIQEFLGHKNIAATQIYAHVTNKQLREIHRKFHSGNRLK